MPYDTYDTILLDAYNIAHKLFYQTEGRELTSVSQKLIYLEFVRAYMDYVEAIKHKFGAPTCKIYALFDNPDSRPNLKHSAVEYSPHRIRYELDPEYKANRKKYTKEFYNSIQFIKYLFAIKGENYLSVRVPNLEADDLVKPVLLEYCNEGTTLLVSSDMDWCRFLSPSTDMLMNKFSDPITTTASFKEQYGFPPSEERIILHKILFGDSSDNIRPVFPDIPKKVRQLIMEEYYSIHDLYSKPSINPEIAKYQPSLDLHVKDMKIAYQILSSIPVDKDKIHHYVVKGRPAIKLQEIINKIFQEFDEKKPPKKFTFGKINSPRL
jgi:5'-3' exonuclease